MQQGFSITLLFAAIVYFYRELEKQRNEIKAAHDNIVKYLTEDRERLIRLLQETGEILEQNTKILERIEKKL